MPRQIDARALFDTGRRRPSVDLRPHLRPRQTTAG